MFKIYTLCSKMQSERSKSLKRQISSEEINVFMKIHPFPMFGQFLLSLSILWSEFGDSFLFVSDNLGLNTVHYLMA